VNSRNVAPGGLFEPSLQQEVPADTRLERRPWNPWSQFWVAILGGPLAMGAIGYLNAGRLGLPPRIRVAIAAFSVAVLAAVIFAAYWIATGVEDAASGRSQVRIASRVGGAVVYAFAYFLQSQANRIYLARTQHAEPYGSFWIPGIVASVAGGVLSAMLAGSLLFLSGALAPK
jgi:hypothetical protein